MEKRNVSIVSKSFWYSFLGYYMKALGRAFNKTKKHSTRIFFNYGFDILLSFGKY